MQFHLCQKEPDRIGGRQADFRKDRFGRLFELGIDPRVNHFGLCRHDTSVSHLRYTFSILTIGNNSPFPSGTPISSTSRYPRALYNATPVSVAPISNFLNPAASAADSQDSRTRVPIPRRSHSGCTKKALILAASHSGSSSESSRPAQ